LRIPGGDRRATSCADQQLAAMTLPGAKFTALIKKDLDKWEKVAKEAGIMMD
jgi:tripartite-type tricarboxylate transporter receptor subunit TctC